MSKEQAHSSPVDVAPPRAELDPLIALFSDGRAADVIVMGERLLVRYPRSFVVHDLLGLANGMLDRPEQAATCFREALRIKPDYAFGWYNLGLMLQILGDPDEAIPCYERTIEIAPDFAEAYYGLGGALRALDRVEAAVPCYERALELKSDYLEAHYNLGVLLQDLKRTDEAVACFRRAVQIKPDFAEAHNNLGNALWELERAGEAITCYERALKINPDYVEAYQNLAVLMQNLGRVKEAIAYYEHALQLKPDDAAAQAQKLFQQAHLCDWDAILASMDLISTLGVSGPAIPPFTLLSLDDSPERHRCRSERQAAREFQQSLLPTFVRPAIKPNRIRIGYFSADFHDHATMHLMVRLFELHDHSRVSVHIFSYGPDQNDEMRQRLKRAVDAFHDVRTMTDSDVAALARSEKIDIAVDLKGYTHAARLGIFACGAAPVQISFLGYPGTLGTSFMDYIIADRVVIPEEQRRHYTEKVIFLPNSYQVNDNSKPISDHRITRTEMGLPEVGFVFCCFNNSSKIGVEEFDIWMRLLDRIDGGVLWLFRTNRWVEDNLREQAGKRGVDPNRLIFAERMPLPEHLARHRLADLFLDTFNCNAHTTASDALWAGLPIVTRCGQGFPARVASSLLTAVGLPELITTTSADYERLALELARDPNRLSQLREKLAANRLTQPLFDTALFARHVEAAYERAYEHYFEGRAPADIVIDQTTSA